MGDQQELVEPDGTFVDWEADIYNNNYLKYTTLVADFNIKGTYKIQAYIVMTDWTGLGETALFVIYDVFK